MTAITKRSTRPSVLVTGGAGYIGSVLTRSLLEKDFKVTVLDNFLYRQTSLLDCFGFPDFSVVRGDCRDERIVRDLAKSADIVIPLAALVGAPICDRDQTAARSTNVDAVRMLCGMLSPAQRVLYPVTNSGYGVGEKGKFCTEETPLRPISLYGVTKVEAEKIVLERENSISFRLATVFGVSPRMRLDLLVNDFVWRAVTDRALVIFEGHFKRNYIHVSDVTRVFLHGLAKFSKMRGEAYNVGLEDANLSKVELCRVIRKIIPSFVFFEAPIGEDVDKRDYIVSNKKILKTGFRPDWSLERGIRQLVKAYAILKNANYGNV
ncbi:NAD-dependent epimerase/dehydratase family protein [bacterium]|nr:NAD-dependent epimerase/dehydratase family protein [bacterium]